MPSPTSTAKARSISLEALAFAVTKRSPRGRAAVSRALIEGSSIAGGIVWKKRFRQKLSSKHSALPRICGPHRSATTRHIV